MSVDGEDGRDRTGRGEVDVPSGGERVREEMSHHLEELQARLEAEGISADEARGAASLR